MASYTHDSQFVPRRVVTFVIAAGVQIALFVIFETGLASRVMNIVAPPIQTDIVQEVQKRDQPPPPPPPKMERPPVEVPPPDVTINLPAETNTSAITVVKTPKPRVYAPAPVHHAVRIGARLDAQHSPSTDDYYPPTSRRLEETGTTLVGVCSSPEGRVAGTPKVERSSGSARLDEAAVRWASHARFFPATDDGKPVAGCTQFKVTFKLTG
ncbi:MAG TPA: energy transducer TonB [Steroidobacteraceae bacterium]|nr:energy transducer TonB [Steroidobacteraceae bacterium]